MKNRRILWAPLIVLLLLPICFASENRKLSQEYINARTEVVKELRGIYSACTKKVSREFYSNFFQACIEDPNERIRKDRCGHDAQTATDKFMMQDDGGKPCEHLKPETADYKKRLEEVVEERGIRKYE